MIKEEEEEEKHLALPCKSTKKRKAKGIECCFFQTLSHVNSSSLKIANLTSTMETEFKTLPIELPFLHSLTQVKNALYTSGGRNHVR